MCLLLKADLNFSALSPTKSSQTRDLNKLVSVQLTYLYISSSFLWQKPKEERTKEQSFEKLDVALSTCLTHFLSLKFKAPGPEGDGDGGKGHDETPKKKQRWRDERLRKPSSSKPLTQEQTSIFHSKPPSIFGPLSQKPESWKRPVLEDLTVYLWSSNINLCVRERNV